MIGYINNRLLESTLCSKFNIKITGILGAIGFPLYWVIWTYFLPQNFDSFNMRMAVAVLSIGIFFYKKWPNQLQKYFPLYWHFSLVCALPFFHTYLLLKNDFSNTSSTAYAIVTFLLLILVSDVLLTVALFITGSLLGLLLFMITESSFVINVDRAQFYLPLTAFMFLGGTLLINGLRKGNIFLEQQANQQRQNAIRSLAGSIAHEMRNPLG
jgi:two-component system CAI-1 autoinducer sensor kinase/phosphatase CqsS